MTTVEMRHQSRQRGATVVLGFPQVEQVACEPHASSLKSAEPFGSRSWGKPRHLLQVGKAAQRSGSPRPRCLTTRLAPQRAGSLIASLLND
ncbi:hypothetical protein [Dendronalium sp. ChiSLP03b]|uniref:hypothetical protein n=1 Tax=Dendronalium sp. ChiSLP03b TaxID=3075381 RepID=UPI002AD44C2A|nr:hypothetical protein [Dendronalium sp. ChiSLP03b]MDZ8208472.1 hypothetical protein [Dendronalium sp. ChiSLP03b]